MKALALIFLLLPVLAHADPSPSFFKLRFDDSYDYLSAPGREPTFHDRLKRIALQVPDSFFSVGGEARLRYDYQENPEWGDGLQDRSGAFLQRYLLHGNLELGQHIRAFAELRSALEDGRRGPESPVEEGELALQQAFLDLRGEPTGRLTLGLRGGRQEIAFGSERLVSAREGPSIRRRFDAVRADFQTDAVSATALFGYLTENEQGVFNDGVDGDVALWGLYGVLDSVMQTATAIDLYYLGYRNERARFAQGSARELRHSVGARIHGRSSGADWNWEGIVQWGEFGNGDILAWTVATETGYRFERIPLAPRLFLSANVASGDKNPSDDDLETFNPIFPRGNYFSHIALLGPRNFANLHPGVEFEVSRGVSLGLDANFFWRLEKSDGIYGPAGNLLRGGLGTDKRYVGTAVSASIDWNVNAFLFLGLIYTHGFTGSFVEATGQAKDIDFVEATVRFRF